jgi:phosphonate transport system ATP-binding protein
MQDAEVILADEPISNLDPELAEDALARLVDCARRRGETLVVNLHQPALACQFASRLIGLSDGKIIYDGVPERFTADVAEFLYRGSSREEKNGGGVVLPVRSGKPAG